MEEKLKPSNIQTHKESNRTKNKEYENQTQINPNFLCLQRTWTESNPYIW